MDSPPTIIPILIENNKLERILSFGFDKKEKFWSTTPTPNTPKPRNNKDNNIRFRVATFNVLHNYNGITLEWFIQSQKRNANMIKLITELDADIICLNEVTVSTLQLIEENEVIRRNYFVSDIPEDDKVSRNKSISDKNVYGNILLSRFPFLEIYSYTFMEQTCKRKVIFGLFEIGNEKVLVGGLHITPLKGNGPIRKLQMDEVKDVLKRAEYSNITKNVILVGDLNFHDESENECIEEEFIDLWKETHGSIAPTTIRSYQSVLLSYTPSWLYSQPDPVDEDGYTFDSLVNTMIPYYVPFERRRMRLDRILLKKESNLSPLEKVKKFANEPIEKGKYLFTSDHFGLFIDMTIDQDKQRNRRNSVTL